MNNKTYSGATICMNGHVLSKYDSNSQKYCNHCGEETISLCPNCQDKIRGLVQLDIAYIGTRPYDPPAYCYNCSKAFPWTKNLLNNAIELIALDTNLDSSTKEIIKNALPEIIIDTPSTPVAVEKYKIHMEKASKTIKDGMYNLLVDVLSESVKKSIFG